MFNAHQDWAAQHPDHAQFMRNDTWAEYHGYNPDPTLNNYSGIYPLACLQNARTSLIRSLKYDSSDLLERIKPKIGIGSSYGPPLRLSPPGVRQVASAALGSASASRPTGNLVYVPTARPSTTTKDTTLKTLSSTQNASASTEKMPKSDLIKNTEQMTPLTAVTTTTSASCDQPQRVPGSSQQPIGTTLTSSALNIQQRASGSIEQTGGYNKSAKPAEYQAKSSSNLVSSVHAQNRQSSKESFESNLILIPTEDFGDEDIYIIEDLSYLKRKLTMENSEEPSLAKKMKPLTESSPSTDKTLQQIYKCDFCNYRGSTITGMEFHLEQAKHFSASLYNMNGPNMVSVEQKLAVKNKLCKNQTLAVVCPECKDLFEDIFMCAVHYRYMHGHNMSTNGCYSVCPIIHQETVLVLQAAQCKKCNESFTKQKDLHKHWEKYKDHHPVQKALCSEKSFALYSCMYCNKSFYGDFLSCKAHVLDHKVKNALRSVSSLKVQYIMLPNRTEEVPPFAEKSDQDGYNDELMMLTNMKKHLHGMSASKAKVKLVDQRMKYLQGFSNAKMGGFLN